MKYRCRRPSIMEKWTTLAFCLTRWHFRTVLRASVLKPTNYGLRKTAKLTYENSHNLCAVSFIKWLELSMKINRKSHNIRKYLIEHMMLEAKSIRSDLRLRIKLCKMCVKKLYSQSFKNFQNRAHAIHSPIYLTHTISALFCLGFKALRAELVV